MLLRGAERADLLRDECLPDIVAATATRRPEHPALIYERRVVTYRELDSSSSTVAGALMRHGATDSQVVGLWMPRSCDALIGQLAISKSGAAWLPFDADTPPERIQVCLQSAQAVGLLTCREWLPRTAGLPVPVWAIEDLFETPDSTPAPAAPAVLRPDSPAYVIYTSGSTGQPKGIVVSHRSICHFLRSENELLGVGEEDRVYQGFSLAFDMSFEEIWISYLVGATLWIAPAALGRDPELLARALGHSGITVLHAVPTLLSMIDDPLPTVRLINLGGEACPDVLVERLSRPGRRLLNTYGPTEASVSASLAVLQPGAKVTIGHPLPNYGLMVLDGDRQPLPAGEVGELAIFGPGLAIGYLGRPDLTADRFIANPLAGGPNESRLYLTGDMARIEPGGPVHCLGRADGQIKLRGFRIELGEIEAALAEQPGVSAAAVVVRNLAEIEQQVVGFVVAALDCDVNLPALRKSLSARLPPYMVPVHIEILLQLPRLLSGKIDRKTLGNQPLLTREQAADGHPARNDEEAALYAALGKLFPGRALQPDADFFDDLGGHSLLAARLVSLLRADPRYATLSVRDVYQQRSLESIAGAMSRERQRKPRAADPSKADPSKLDPSRSGVSRVAIRWQRRVCCGLAQSLVIPGLVLLHIARWLAPFFTYHYFTGDEGDSILRAAAAALAVLVLTTIATFAVAIAGKWLVQGRVEPGRYPLWGVVYFRSWLAGQLSELPPVRMLSATPLLCWYLRALGARIGRDAFIDSVRLRVPDLLTIDEGASIGAGVHIENARVEDGQWVIGRVDLGRDSVIDSYAVLEEGTALGDGARLAGLSALSAGRAVPAGEIWEGAPARRTDRKAERLAPRPRVARWLQLAQTLFFAAAALAVSALFFMPVFASFMLIDWIDARTWDLFQNESHPLVAFGGFFLLSIPASPLLLLATVLLAAGLRWLLLPRQLAGVWSIHSLAYCRKWLLTQVLDSSLEVLHGLYASVFAPAWLRLLGAEVGRGAEVSTATGIIPDLLTLGEHSFIADGVMLGDEEQRGGWMVLRPTLIGNRTFVGNHAYIPNGAVVPDDVLIGVQSRAPDNSELQSGQVWMGSPPLLLPARECLTGFADSLTFHPSPWRRLGRATVETLRLVLPMAFVIASGYLIIHAVMPLPEQRGWLVTAVALAVAGCLYGLASFLLVVVLKWVLIGRYRPRAAAMWTSFVWLSEAVTNLYESLAVPNFLDFLRGTPMMPWALRLLGAKLGKGVYLDTTDLTEFDCVRIGDHAELNGGSGPQTHLFEDRVMKIGMVDIGARVCVGSASIILYDTEIGDDVRLGPMTLVAKGERLPAETRWEGSPASPLEGE